MYYKFLLLTVYSLILSVVCEAQYDVKDLGLREIGNSFPLSINNRDEVIGTVQIGDKEEFFYWNPQSGKTILYQIPKGATVVQMNNCGQVIGHFSSWEGVWAPQLRVHPFIWSDESGFVSIDAIDSQDTMAVSINDCGQAILMTKEGSCYLWQNGDLKKIDEATNLFQEKYTYSALINSQEFVFVNTQGFLCRKDLKTNQLTSTKLRYTHHMIKGLNKMGQLVGTGLNQNEQIGFLLYKNGKLLPLTNFLPMDINDSNCVVGTILSTKRRGGIFFDNLKLYDINTLVLPKEKQSFAFDEIISLNGINEQGTIVGVARTGKVSHVVILTNKGN